MQRETGVLNGEGSSRAVSDKCNYQNTLIKLMEFKNCRIARSQESLMLFVVINILHFNMPFFSCRKDS